MQVYRDEAKISDVQEPQFEIVFCPETTSKKSQEIDTLNVLSLFSGCGGMDLGFEGGKLIASTERKGNAFCSSSLCNG